MKVLIENRQRLIKINLRRLKRDSLALLTAFHLNKAELGILLVSDRQMKRLNFLYRSLNTPTDVLSFPLYEQRGEIPDDRESLVGDIVINLNAAARQSSLYGLTSYNEVRRLLIHGFLHLLGYDHERNPYQQKKMRRQESDLRKALEALD
ncbi:MAG TPA: rRNA maturation RNase YbeY [Thermodesulfovibrionales bacterium]|nr:rRNA maturation RNase YbeY [Thermodesulfovibrionales bacterium]